jgi:hypothetical protein
VLRSITDEIMYALMELSGQEYVDVYAAKAKEQTTDVPEQGKPSDRVPEPTDDAVRALAAAAHLLASATSAG